MDFRNKQLKNPRTILETLGYWLNFELSCRRQELFTERHMSYPIGQFLIARYGHSVRTEFEHPILSPHLKGPGNRPKIDFVVLGENQNHEIELAIETKWVSKSNTLAKDICQDLIRLAILLEKNNCSAYLIVAGKKSLMETLFKNSSISFLPTDNNSSPGKFDLLKLYNSNDKFMKSVLEKKFNNVNLPNSIVVKQISGFSHNLRESQYPIYGWRIMKRNVKTFKNNRAQQNL